MREIESLERENARLRAALRALVEHDPLHYVVGNGHFCAYCERRLPEAGPLPHDSACPVVQARALLAQNTKPNGT
jgi:hypothetical protein